jgi:hypothetical protein
MMQISGRCACGQVCFTANGEPIAQFYCHCRSCQIAHAAPLLAGAMFPASCVTYTGEVRRVTVTAREGATPRFVCTQCGTKVLNEPRPTLRTVMPALCDTTDWFRPEMHMQWQERMLDVQDDLPKFLDFPEQFGGTGKRV